MTLRDVETLDLATPSGPMRTLLWRPTAEGRFPGIVLFTEIFQITGPMRRTAAFLAGHGYAVAVPEIYHELEPAGTVLAYQGEEAERGNRHKNDKPLAAFDADARAALDSLAVQTYCTGRCGTVGFCVGGHLALRAAMNPEVHAAACFYATDIHKRGLGGDGPDNTLDRLGDLHGEVMMAWGRNDPHVPLEGRATIYNALTEAKARFEWHEFGAAHAFMRDDGYRYDPPAAAACLSMALALFARRLSG